MPRLFIWKTQRLRSKPGQFFRNIPDTSIIALQTIFPKRFRIFRQQHFRKTVPEICVCGMCVCMCARCACARVCARVCVYARKSYFSNLPKNVFHRYVRSTTGHANAVSINLRDYTLESLKLGRNRLASPSHHSPESCHLKYPL